jgi:uncharacterized protein
MKFQERKLAAAAKRYFKGCRGSHGWDHVQRVVGLCKQLGRAEGAAVDILTTAALLHDIGRKQEDDSRGRRDHAKLGARLAGSLLREYSLTATERQRIVECIRTHRFRDGHDPVSIEAKVLYDADKIDSLGAVGVGRAFLFAGEVGARLVNERRIADSSSYSREDTAYREYLVKLRKLPAKLCTVSGRRIARERARVMREFFRAFRKETAGNLRHQ